MTLFALAGKCAGLGASGSAASGVAPKTRSCSIMANSASSPNPPPARSRNSRRELNCVRTWRGSGSIDINELIQVEQHQTELSERAGTDITALAGEHLLRLLPFIGGRRPRQRQAPALVHPDGRVVRLFGQAIREIAGAFEHEPAVHQGKGLGRNIRDI